MSSYHCHLNGLVWQRNVAKLFLCSLFSSLLDYSTVFLYPLVQLTLEIIVCRSPPVPDQVGSTARFEIIRIDAKVKNPWTSVSFPTLVLFKPSARVSATGSYVGVTSRSIRYCLKTWAIERSWVAVLVAMPHLLAFWSSEENGMCAQRNCAWSSP